MQRISIRGEINAKHLTASTNMYSARNIYRKRRDFAPEVESESHILLEEEDASQSCLAQIFIGVLVPRNVERITSISLKLYILRNINV